MSTCRSVLRASSQQSGRNCARVLYIWFLCLCSHGRIQNHLGSSARHGPSRKPQKTEFEKTQNCTNDRRRGRYCIHYFTRLIESGASMYDFLRLAKRQEVRTRAFKVSLVVGSILALINHSDSFFTGKLEVHHSFQIIATFLVPYLVSTYSSVRAIKHQEYPSDNKL